MTNEDIAEQLAVKVMGWYLDMVENEWGLRFYKGADGNVVMDIRLWRPAEDLNQAVMCAENSEYGWNLEHWKNRSPRTIATIWRDEQPGEIVEIYGKHDNPARALCEAVLMAVDNG